MKWIARKKEAGRWKDENTLKQFYNPANVHLETGLNPSIKRLLKNRLIQPNNNGSWELSPKGVLEAERIVRKHRLWETFLHNRLLIPQDSVHENAELMEHLLDDDAEERLSVELNNPGADPHQSPIPPKK